MTHASHMVVGLGYGDEGKGTTVDYLVRSTEARTVVRFNGGAQAAHHVVAPDGTHHCFAQFGAGTLVDGCRTVLSRFVVFDPLALELEADALLAAGVRAPLQRVLIDPRCVVLTPYHRLMNRAQELSRGAARHGSCGIGVGQAQLDSENPALPTLRVADLTDVERCRRVLRDIQMVKVDQAEQLIDEHPENAELSAVVEELERLDVLDALVERFGRLATHSGVTVAEDLTWLRDTPCVFEGAQGTLLDRDFGFWPHVTPSYTTFRNAEALCAELDDQREVRRVGVLRAYHTRHGAGPFVTEEPELSLLVPACHNQQHRWQGRFRLGWFDVPAARYAIDVCRGVDQLMLTSADRLVALSRLRVCVDYSEPAGESPVLPACASTAGEDFAQRTALSAKLAQASPSLIDLPIAWPGNDLASGAEALAVELEVLLDTPIGWLSLGPKATDKRVRQG